MRRLIPVAGLILLMLFSCSRPHKFSTMGTEYQITLFADEEVEIRHGRLIEEELSSPLYFTHRESVFEVTRRDMESVGKFMNFKNIVFIDDVSTEDAVTVFLKDVLGETLLNNVTRISVAHQKDVWTEGQSVLFLLFNGTGYTEEEVRQAMAVGHNRLFEYIGERIQHDLGKEKTSKKAAQKSQELFGFSFLIPARYAVFKESGDFLSFVTRSPDRLFFVTELDNTEEPVTRAFMIGARNAVTEEYYGGDRVFEELYRWKEKEPDVPYYGGLDIVTVAGHPVYKLTGLWENPETIHGGPFITYLVEFSNRRFLLDAMLFHPSGSKWPFLNKMDASLKRSIEDIYSGESR